MDDCRISSSEALGNAEANSRSRLKWNYLVEKVKEEKYNLDHKRSAISEQLKETSDNLGNTVKLQATVVLSSSTAKAKELELAVRDKSHKIKEKSHLTTDSIKEKSNEVRGAIKTKSASAAESLKRHPMVDRNTVKSKIISAGESIKDNSRSSLKVMTQKVKVTGESGKFWPNRDITNVDEKHQCSYEGYHNDTQNLNKDLRILRKSEEILRKKARTVGQKS